MKSRRVREEGRPRGGFLYSIISIHRAGSPLRQSLAYHTSLPVTCSISIPNRARHAPMKLTYSLLVSSFAANRRPMKKHATAIASMMSIMVCPFRLTTITIHLSRRYATHRRVVFTHIIDTGGLKCLESLALQTRLIQAMATR